MKNSDVMPGPLYDTRIPVLGKAEIPSPLPGTFAFGENPTAVLNIDEELVDEFSTPQPITFELAGPRQKIYFDPCTTKCAIVTCGGLCPGINDVIRAIVMTASQAYNLPSVLGIHYGLQGFIPSYHFDPEELTVQSVSHIHEFGGTILGTSRGPQKPEEIVNTLERLNVNVLFIIGGDGTMKAAASIQQEIARRHRKISVIGIPKTIDNDINFIPQSFGFETAVDKASDAVRCAHTEAASISNGIGIVKLMGRESGFITANAALTLREVAFVLVPEVPFSLEGTNGLLPALEYRLKQQGHAVIAVAEGAGQNLLATSFDCDASGNRHLGDIAQLLMQSIATYLSQRAIPYHFKYIDPSYMIRSIPANASDRLYCGFLGQHAVHAAMAGKTGMVVAKLMGKFVHLPLALVTRKRRTMNTHSDLWRSVLESTGQGEMMSAPVTPPSDPGRVNVP